MFCKCNLVLCIIDGCHPLIRVALTAFCHPMSNNLKKKLTKKYIKVCLSPSPSPMLISFLSNCKKIQKQYDKSCRALTLRESGFYGILF